MSARAAVNQSAQIGVEETVGSPVRATHLLGSLSVALTPKVDTFRHRPDGQKFDSVIGVLREWTDVSVTGIPDARELGILLDAVVGNRVTAGTPGNWFHQFQARDRGCDSVPTFTIERGSPCADGVTSTAVRTAGVVLESLSLEWARNGDMSVSAEGFGRPLEGAGTQLVDEPFSILSGTAKHYINLGEGIAGGDGSFALDYGGFGVTEPIEYATDTNVRTAIEDLLGAGSVLVRHTGAPGTGTFEVTYIGEFWQRSIDPPTVVEHFTTGEVTVVVGAVAGVTRYEPAPLLPASVAVFSDPAGLPAVTQIPRVLKLSWEISGRFEKVWYLDGSGSWSEFVEAAPDMTLKLTVPADVEGLAEGLGRLRQGSRRSLEVAATAAAGALLLSIAGTWQVEDIGDLGEEDSVYAYEITFRPVVNPTTGKSHRITLANDTPALVVV